MIHYLIVVSVLYSINLVSRDTKEMSWNKCRNMLCVSFIVWRCVYILHTKRVHAA